MINVENRQLVLPGELIAEGDYVVHEGAFREKDQIYSAVLGLTDIREKIIRVIALQGRYIPKRGDRVIGLVIDEFFSGWALDINSPYTGKLFVSGLLDRKVDLDREDISQYLSIGDVVMAEVDDVDELMRVTLRACDRDMGKMTDGKLVDISPAKTPRVIGRKGSMISTLQRAGDCRVRVGQNGRVMVWGPDPGKIGTVVEAILMIEREAHTSGLTDRVREFLEKDKGGK